MPRFHSNYFTPIVLCCYCTTMTSIKLTLFMRAPLKTALAGWAPSINIIIIIFFFSSAHACSNFSCGVKLTCLGG